MQHFHFAHRAVAGVQGQRAVTGWYLRFMRAALQQTVILVLFEMKNIGLQLMQQRVTRHINEEFVLFILALRQKIQIVTPQLTKRREQTVTDRLRGVQLSLQRVILQRSILRRIILRVSALGIVIQTTFER